ncbi:MAG: lysine exporter LysO family protein [Clostridiales Family XIII bacterium]|jgi:uncharacterized membrane protein YbjE (DUF340 family)|nr:lysine exporter LysO family protein [Clostridiales Family XIII bacterium]
MTLIPFACLAIGAAVGWRGLSARILAKIDMVTNLALVALMLTIGTNIGASDTIMSNLPFIGLNCVVIAVLAVVLSVACTFLSEKTVLPLEKARLKISLGADAAAAEAGRPEDGCGETGESGEGSPLVWIMPGSIIAGAVFGFFLMPEAYVYVLDHTLTASLIVLYVSVGISLGANKGVLKYVKQLGFRVVFLPVAILTGSLSGGFLAGCILNIPMHIPVMSAAGMSYYSITGAYMSQAYGVETGTYGFIVNVMREFFTVASLPLLIKISKGSPIAGGAAGNMDTMLAPVTKFVGAELGIVTLFTGTALTFLVPFLLPLLRTLFLL